VKLFHAKTEGGTLGSTTAKVVRVADFLEVAGSLDNDGAHESVSSVILETSL
jgi:hypothetical protein